MTSKQIIWLVEEGQYELAQVNAAFTIEADAKAYAKDVEGTVYDCVLYDGPVDSDA